MGKIREGKNGDSYYYADAGYVVPTKPKTRSVYDYETRKHNTLGDYTLEQFVEAEKAYNEIKTFLYERYNGAFTIVQPSETNRIATIIPTVLYKHDFSKPLNRGWWVWNDFAFYTLSLQQGTVYNIPTTKLYQLFKIDFTFNVNDIKGGGNKGCSVAEALSVATDYEEKARQLFLQNGGHEMTSEQFALFTAAFKLHTGGVIGFDVPNMVEYIASGLELDHILFGFNKRLLVNTSLACIPVEHVKEYAGLPIEWVERLISK